MSAGIAASATCGKSRGARIKVVDGGKPGDWRAIYDRLDSSGNSAPLLGLAVAFAAFAGLSGVVIPLAATIWHFFPGTSLLHMAVFTLPPGFLIGAAAAQAGGNLFFRLRYRLDNATRRGFAARLTLDRTPASWPGALRRWLFTGDWLGTPELDIRLPYLRIFVIGDAPESCSEEDSIWREIHRAISGDRGWEAGANHREISYPAELPAWARGVENGGGMENLRERIGEQAANDWVAHLRRSARRHWPALGDGFSPETTRRDGFEMHSIQLSRAREALAVVLRPVPRGERTELKKTSSQPRPAFLEDSAVFESVL